MVTKLPIYILEPDDTLKRSMAALSLSGIQGNVTDRTERLSDIKQRLKSIREYARDNAEALAEELKITLHKKYPWVKVKSAANDIDAISYICEISGGLNLVSTNNSSVILQELKPGLVAKGFTVINSYLSEFDIKEKRLRDYWDIWHLFDEEVRDTATFSITENIEGLPDNESKKYLALLGVNAISAKEGVVYFLEHFSNIDKDLRQANKVVLVIGLEKIVKTSQEAALQSQCMGIFGMESILLNLKPKSNHVVSIDELLPPLGNEERQLYIIILDNGRKGLLQSKFIDLFLCIGCQSCNKHCPIRHSFNVDYIWTPRNYLRQFMNGAVKSIDTCLHCEACHIECPLDIDLPQLMWQAKMDYAAHHHTSFHHKILGKPEMLAKLGSTLAPFSCRIMRLKPLRAVMEMATGIDRRANLPLFHSRTFRRRFRKNDRRFSC